MAKRAAAEVAHEALRVYGLTFPGAHEDHPWGHTAIKVNGKIFAISGVEGSEFSLSVKLPHSGREALLLPFATPTHYGMGKHGWVTARFEAGREPPLAILRGWIDESYRAIAPKKLVAALEARSAASAQAPAAPAARRATRAKPTATRKKVARRSK